MDAEDFVCGTCGGVECPSHGCRCCPNSDPRESGFVEVREKCGLCCGRNVPKPEQQSVRLSADMLGKEDRRNLLELRNLAYLRSIQLCGALRHDAKACIAWADRLLND